MSDKFISRKKNLSGCWVAIMNYTRNDRSLKLSSYRTRCFSQGEVHEFLVCDLNANSLDTINEVGYLGFGEIIESGVMEIGDQFYCNGILIGNIEGFDETHMPNHYNILVRCKSLTTGEILGYKPSDLFEIKKKEA